MAIRIKTKRHNQTIWQPTEKTTKNAAWKIASRTYLSEIDRIRTLRGELPHEVKDLEDEIERYRVRIQKFQDEIAQSKEFVVKKKNDITMRRDKIARYEDQINNVRNNREYAFLEKEKEFENLEIELAEKNIKEALELQINKNQEIANAQEELADNEHSLEDKRKELQQIVSETKQDEENILIKAKELETQVDPRTLQAFKRIRKNAHNGLGIVTVQRNACGGCFNRIPAQRQLEIKMHKKVIVCEYCGRILVDGALVGIQEATPEPAPKPTKRTLRSKAQNNNL